MLTAISCELTHGVGSFRACRAGSSMSGGVALGVHGATAHNASKNPRFSARIAALSRLLYAACVWGKVTDALIASRHREHSGLFRHRVSASQYVTAAVVVVVVVVMVVVKVVAIDVLAAVTMMKTARTPANGPHIISFEPRERVVAIPPHSL